MKLSFTKHRIAWLTTALVSACLLASSAGALTFTRYVDYKIINDGMSTLTLKGFKGILNTSGTSYLWYGTPRNTAPPANISVPAGGSTTIDSAMILYKGGSFLNSDNLNTVFTIGYQSLPGIDVDFTSSDLGVLNKMSGFSSLPASADCHYQGGNPNSGSGMQCDNSNAYPAKTPTASCNIASTKEDGSHVLVTIMCLSNQNNHEVTL